MGTPCSSGREPKGIVFRVGSFFLLFDTNWSPLERGNLNYVIALRRLACVQICGGISWFMIDVRGSSQLWAVPALGKWLHWRRKLNKLRKASQWVVFLGVFNFSSGFHIAFLASLPDGLQPASQINPFLLCLLLIMFFFLSKWQIKQTKTLSFVKEISKLNKRFKVYNLESIMIHYVELKKCGL